MLRNSNIIRVLRNIMLVATGRSAQGKPVQGSELAGRWSQTAGGCLMQGRIHVKVFGGNSAGHLRQVAA